MLQTFFQNGGERKGSDEDSEEDEPPKKRKLVKDKKRERKVCLLITNYDSERVYIVMRNDIKAIFIPFYVPILFLVCFFFMYIGNKKNGQKFYLAQS